MLGVQGSTFLGSSEGEAKEDAEDRERLCCEEGVGDDELGDGAQVAEELEATQDGDGGEEQHQHRCGHDVFVDTSVLVCEHRECGNRETQHGRDDASQVDARVRHLHGDVCVGQDEQQGDEAREGERACTEKRVSARSSMVCRSDA